MSAPRVCSAPVTPANITRRIIVLKINSHFTRLRRPEWVASGMACRDPAKSYRLEGELAAQLQGAWIWVPLRLLPDPEALTELNSVWFSVLNDSNLSWKLACS